MDSTPSSCLAQPSLRPARKEREGFMREAPMDIGDQRPLLHLHFTNNTAGITRGLGCTESVLPSPTSHSIP